MKRSASEYIWAFSRGHFEDGEELPTCAPRSLSAEEFKEAKKPITVSLAIKYFILNQIDKSENKYVRTVDLGKIALHSNELVKKPVPITTELPISKYTAWGGFYCDRLARQGVIVKTKIPAPAGPRKNTTVYVLTTAGKQWLEDNKIV